jgi:hypothetical protein
MNIRHHVELSQAERCELTALVGGGKHSARKIKRAQILLSADSWHFRTRDTRLNCGRRFLVTPVGSSLT